MLGLKLASSILKIGKNSKSDDRRLIDDNFVIFDIDA